MTNASNNTLTIASCNLQNLFEHSSKHKIMHFILALSDPLEMPDIIALQEIGAESDSAETTAKAKIATRLISEIKRTMDTQYHYVEIAPLINSTGGANSLNIRPAFLLKDTIKLLNVENIGINHHAFTGNDELQYHPSRYPLAIKVQKQSHFITLINCHLKSQNGPTNKDKKLAKKQRHHQVEVITQYCNQFQNENIIILGDFNDFPNSDTLKLMTNDRFRSTWDQYQGRLFTTKHRNCPVTLDYILIDRQLTFKNSEVHHINTNLTYPFRYSDHDPISVEILL